MGVPTLWDRIQLFFAKKTDVPSASTSTPVMDGTGAAGTSTAWAKGDHVHPTDTSRAPVDHKSTATTYGVGNSASYGHLKLSNATQGTSGVSDGVAATPKAVSDALAAAKTYADDNDQDTKNTAGATDSSSKLFIVGATEQTANPQTYSQDSAYVGTDGHVYSNSKQAVNLSDTQALTNKTYNGYTLADACAKSVTDSSSASAIGTGTSVPTERDIYYGLPNINGAHTYNSGTDIYAPTSAGTSGQVPCSSGSGAPTWISALTNQEIDAICTWTRGAIQ